MSKSNGDGTNRNGKPKVTGKGRGKGGGRPEVEIDMDQIEKLAGLNCSLKEIALVAGCSVDTLGRRCADIIEKGRAEMKVSLKRGQFAMAMGSPAEYDKKGNLLRAEVKPNTTMQIWLGKVILEQVEAARLEISGEVEHTYDDVRASLQSRMDGIATRIGSEGVFRQSDGRPSEST